VLPPSQMIQNKLLKYSFRKKQTKCKRIYYIFKESFGETP